jgi:hypothetical protein
MPFNINSAINQPRYVIKKTWLCMTQAYKTLASSEIQTNETSCPTYVQSFKTTYL